MPIFQKMQSALLGLAIPKFGWCVCPACSMRNPCKCSLVQKEPAEIDDTVQASCDEPEVEVAGFVCSGANVREGCGGGQGARLHGVTQGPKETHEIHPIDFAGAL